MRGTYEGDRAILNRQTDILTAPVTLTCLTGHTQELWMTPEEAVEAIQSVGVVAR